ncbi:type II toxin-antitoxin system PrlF family antitoxin [Alkalibacterium sp. MB6]|uniref:type II toxin-antitoxin system PrlF family antitoxin n=1 Tax=Alkalibacterium sp. MB6 TaxID=2081965 RepID=UPI0013794DC6|nr:type II toxin-antitoxin system PrlF family antitoxin [Alkalibacterium sp. MB6]
MTVSKEYVRKTKKTGNSIQATIPADIAKHLNIQEGDSVLYKVNSNGDVVIKKQKTISEEMGVDKEFLSILQEGMTEYKDALEDLVDR